MSDCANTLHGHHGLDTVVPGPGDSRTWRDKFVSYSDRGFQSPVDVDEDDLPYPLSSETTIPRHTRPRTTLTRFAGKVWGLRVGVVGSRKNTSGRPTRTLLRYHLVINTCH